MSRELKVWRSRDPEQVKTRILDAAQAEFMASGYAGASTNRMLELFGGSKPTMFRHFPSKRALFDGVVARIASRWASQIDWQHIDRAEPGAWLRAFGSMALSWILTDENIFVGRMAIAEGAAFPEVSATYRSLAVEPIEAVLAAQFRAWHVSSVLVATDPERDAVCFLDLALSGVVARKLYRVQEGWSSDDVAEHVAYATDLFLNGRLPR
jgi:AcrR family transcriptional regulator